MLYHYTILGMDVPPEEQIPSVVRTRNMPAIKHDDIVVRNSKVRSYVQVCVVCVCMECCVYVCVFLHICDRIWENMHSSHIRFFSFKAS